MSLPNPVVCTTTNMIINSNNKTRKRSGSRCKHYPKQSKKSNRQHYLASSSSSSIILLLQILLVEGFAVVVFFAHAEPMIRPYVPFRTSPFDHEKSQITNKVTQWDDLVESVSSANKNQKKKNGVLARTYLHDTNNYGPHNHNGNNNERRENIDDDQELLCSYSFTLGVSRRSHHDLHHAHHQAAQQQQQHQQQQATTTTATTSASSKIHGFSIVQSPIIYPVFPSRGPGRQVLHTTLYEHLDLLSPILPFSVSSSPSLSSSSLSSSSSSSSSSKSRASSQSSSSSSIVKEGLVQHQDFPLLFESSTFTHSSPIIHDVNGDGIPDAILTDYDGGIYVIGLYANPEEKDGSGGQRYFHRGQVPRIYLRRHWVEARLNETLPSEVKKDEEEELVPPQRLIDDDDRYNRYHHDYEKSYDPYHSYFEWGDTSNHAEPNEVLRGVTANVLGQENSHAKQLQERRNKNQLEQQQKQMEQIILLQHQLNSSPSLETKQEQKENKVNNEDKDGMQGQEVEETPTHRRLTEVDIEGEFQELEEELEDGQQQVMSGMDGDDKVEGEGEVDDEYGLVDDEGDVYRGQLGDDQMLGDDLYGNGGRIDDFVDEHLDDDDENLHEEGDDIYDERRRRNTYRDDFYDDKHYVRINPHILCTPTWAELPKLHNNDNNNQVEEYLLVPVSYYLDEDEYQGLFHYQRFDDEDDHSGDDNEVNRGMYVASAIMVYQMGESLLNQGSGSYHRWGRQEHLELSTDYTSPANISLVGKVPFLHDESRMGAFAMSSPVVVDLKGDGSMSILFGTSMGIVYAFDARSLNSMDDDENNWPVQMKHPIESRIVVEDVVGTTDLELFVMDIGGNLICLDSKGKGIWYRDLLQEINIDNEDEKKMILLGSSGMSLGDVDGDGIMDLVVVLRSRSVEVDDEQGDAKNNNKKSMDDNKSTPTILFAINAATGDNLPEFPISFVVPTTSTTTASSPPSSASDSEEEKSKQYKEENEEEDFMHQKLPQPLLVDLHSDQSFLRDYLNRNGTEWNQPPKKGPGKTGSSSSKSPPPHGGYASGLHIVLPIGEYLYIIEGGSGCIQRTAVGDDVITMIQVDDVHGTNSLDLVVSTVSGNIITFESPNLSVPYHPLNVWNSGESRMGKAVGSNVHAHGYSASQGIFVHDVSRSYRDVFGALVPVTFTIFDNRPNIRNEPDKRVYNVEMRDGTSVQRVIYRRTYTMTGTYTERVYIPYGPGYYTLSILLKTSHGLLYDDTFHIGYNINYMAGFGIMLWLPLMISAIAIVFFYNCTDRTTRSNPYFRDGDGDGDDDDNDDDDVISSGSSSRGTDRTRSGAGILGN